MLAFGLALALLFALAYGFGSDWPAGMLVAHQLSSACVFVNGVGLRVSPELPKTGTQRS